MHRGCGKRLPRGQKRPRLPTCLTFSPRSLLAHSFFLNSSLSPMLVSHLFFLTVIFTLSVFTKELSGMSSAISADELMNEPEPIFMPGDRLTWMPVRQFAPITAPNFFKPVGIFSPSTLENISPSSIRRLPV